MAEARCIFCHRPMSAVGVLHRINAKGEPGIWACRDHLAQTDTKVPPDLIELTEVIAQGSREP